VVADADALLTCYGAGEELGLRPLHAVVELCFTSSVRFLHPGLLLGGQAPPGAAAAAQQAVEAEAEAEAAGRTLLPWQRPAGGLQGQTRRSWQQRKLQVGAAAAAAAAAGRAAGEGAAAGVLRPACARCGRPPALV
jgi:hypothetical protein